MLFFHWLFISFSVSDKVSNVNIDLPTKKIMVTSAMTAEELTEVLKKTGKEITHLSSKPV